MVETGCAECGGGGVGYEMYVFLFASFEFGSFSFGRQCFYAIWGTQVLNGQTDIDMFAVGTYLFSRISSDSGRDSRFDSIRGSPSKFYVAFFAQATWVSLCTLPVILVNSIPRSAYATGVLGAKAAVSAKPYFTDILGLAIFVFGLTFEIIADRQKSAWMSDKKAKKHSEEFLTHGLWSKSRHPNYFGEATLWSGIAIAAAGLLVRQPAQAALGLSGGAAGQVLVSGLCAASPAFVAFLLLKVSGVPLSENKYDKRYGERKDYQKWKNETPMFVPKFW